MLTFQAMTFRDWSVVFSQITQQIFTNAFFKSFGWRHTDVLYVYDSQKVTSYRSNEEHWKGMFNFICTQQEKSGHFIEQICSELSSEFVKLRELLEYLDAEDLSTLDVEILSSKFQSVIDLLYALGPKYVVASLFPQHLEKFTEFSKSFTEQGKLAFEIRSKMYNVFAPVSEKVCAKISLEALRRIGIGEEFARFLSLDELQKILQPSYLNINTTQLKDELARRSKYYLLAEEKILFTTLLEYIDNKGWKLEEEIVEATSDAELKGAVAIAILNEYVEKYV